MKYCTSCGKELSDQAKFCTGCGKKCSDDISEKNQPAPVPQEPDHAEELAGAAPVNREETVLSDDGIPEGRIHQETIVLKSKPEQKSTSNESSVKKKKKRSKGKMILFSILCVLLVAAIAAAVLVVFWYTSTEQQVLRALDNGNYDAALEIVLTDVSASESDALESKLKERITNIRTGFTDGSIEYASARMELETIGKMKIKGISADLREVQTYVDNLNQSRTDFATAESFFTTGDYAEAIGHYQSVIEEDANYETAVKKLGEAVSKYRDEVLTKAAEFADAELYSDAITLLNEALSTIPNDTKITEQIRIYEKSNSEKLRADALAVAAEFARNGDYLRALQSLDSAIKSQGSNAELVSAYNKYCDQYVSQVISAADGKVAEKDFDGAISLLNAALKNLPGNESLRAKMNEVDSKKPVLLSTMTAINGGWKWNQGTPTDPFNNDYSAARNYAIIEAGSQVEYNADDHTYYTYAEYRLYGDYSFIGGVIAPYTSTKDGSAAYIQIYADDELVYTSPDVGRKTDAVQFSVNISGAEYIMMYVVLKNDGSNYYGSYRYYSSLILSDIQLWP